MIKSFAVAATFVSLLFSGPLHAAEPDDAAALSAPADKPKEKTICRRETFVGSNMSKKTCRTAAEWRALDDAGKRAVGERDRNER